MAIANIVVADAATTPVDHTFVPIQDGNDARYVNEAGAQTLAGQETLGFTVKRAPSSGSQANTVRLTMWDPVEAVGDNGVYAVDHGNSSDSRFNFAQKASLQERLDLVTMHINALTAMKDEIAGLRPQL